MSYILVCWINFSVLIFTHFSFDTVSSKLESEATALGANISSSLKCIDAKLNGHIPCHMSYILVCWINFSALICTCFS